METMQELITWNEMMDCESALEEAEFCAHVRSNPPSNMGPVSLRLSRRGGGLDKQLAVIIINW